MTAQGSSSQQDSGQQGSAPQSSAPQGSAPQSSPALGDGPDEVRIEDWTGEVAPDGGPDDCDGEDAEDEALEGVVPAASARGWGPGWPHCQSDKLATVAVGGRVRLAVRREIAPLVGWLCAETIRRGYPLRSGQCWGFACRAIRGRNVASNHSWGLAVDLNSLANPMGPRLVTDMPSWLPQLWRDHGFRWGGDYSGRKDAMHYEYVRTPDAAARTVARLGAAAKAATKPATKPTTPPAAKPAAKSATKPTAGRAAPAFPLPAGHWFGVDQTPDSHTGRRPEDRPRIRMLQARLVERGWDLGPDGADGWYGPVTARVVTTFQREKGLQVDGRVGTRTWAALWNAPITR